MEPAASKVDEPFGRQPLPVVVIITGVDRIDVEYWCREFIRRAEGRGDMVYAITSTAIGHLGYRKQFSISPRAVNE